MFKHSKGPTTFLGSIKSNMPSTGICVFPCRSNFYKRHIILVHRIILNSIVLVLQSQVQES